VCFEPDTQTCEKGWLAGRCTLDQAPRHVKRGGWQAGVLWTRHPDILKGEAGRQVYFGPDIQTCSKEWLVGRCTLDQTHRHDRSVGWQAGVLWTRHPDMLKGVAGRRCTLDQTPKHVKQCGWKAVYFRPDTQTCSRQQKINWKPRVLGNCGPVDQARP